MKKWFALLMITVLMISALAACGGGTPRPAPAGAFEALQASLAASTRLTLLQVSKHTMLPAMLMISRMP